MIPKLNDSNSPARGWQRLRLISARRTIRLIGLNFLEAVLHKCKFPGHFIRVVMQCVSTVSYVNGSPSPLFTPTCGLRQGDPLSPYLFVLCTEALSRNLQQAESQRFFSGIKIGRRTQAISHLFFADDCNVYFNCELQACSNIKKIFGDYVAASGQVINFNKSGILVSNILYASYSSNGDSGFFQCYKSA